MDVLALPFWRRNFGDVVLAIHFGNERFGDEVDLKKNILNP